MRKQELKELLSRIDDLGGSADFKSRIISSALSGGTRSALNSQIDEASLRGDFASHNHQTGGNTNTTKTNTSEQRITSFAQVQDDNDFFQGFRTALSPF